MSENQEQQVVAPAQQEETRETVAPQTNPFTGSWTETIPEAKKQPEAVVETKQPEADATVIPPPDEKVFDEGVYLKDNYGFESAEALKERLKQQAPQEWANEDSKKVHELLRQGKFKEVGEFINAQDRIAAYTSVEVDQASAQEILKLAMELKNRGLTRPLTKNEIEFQYKQEYGTPKEPIQRASETEDEFNERVEEWKEKVSIVEQKKVVAAKMSIPELEKLKTTIVLPELEKPQPVKQEPDQKLLEAQAKWAQNFLSALESDYNKVEGFTTEVKDESVTIPVSFKIQDTDKVALKGRFAEGFKLTDYFDKRWFDGSELPKTEQMMKDIYTLENLDKILSGVANNAANQRLEEYKKSIKNVNLSGTRQQTYQPQQNSNSSVNPFATGAWSESLPIPNS